MKLLGLSVAICKVKVKRDLGQTPSTSLLSGSGILPLPLHLIWKPSLPILQMWKAESRMGKGLVQISGQAPRFANQAQGMVGSKGSQQVPTGG